MKQNIWCKFFGLHKYEIIKETKLTDKHGYDVGIVIISRCTNCGKIKKSYIYTEENYER